MIGRKRIVVTLGEKVGKEHLTYTQGASAELVAMGTILAADQIGLPVSPTHGLSSGVAGTIFANRSGLQTETLRNLMLAWVLTLPVCVILGAAISPNYHLVTPEQVRAAHAAGIPVVPWTPDTPADWNRLVDAGVDAIITDHPAALIAYLKENR